jgi:hypothetical protein
VVCVVYIALLWGPISGLPTRLLPAGDGDAVALYLALKSFLFGLIIPAIGVRVMGRPLGDFGITLPSVSSIRLGALFSLVCVPIGFWLAARVPDPWGDPLFVSLELFAMIPEHFLIFGVAMALMLPTRRLPHYRSLNSPDASSIERRPIDSVRLGGRNLFAIVVGAALFQIVHLGSMPTLEILFATPIGLMFAYLTLRTGSIWPALAVHWLLNLLPMAWQSLGPA